MYPLAILVAIFAAAIPRPASSAPVTRPVGTEEQRAQLRETLRMLPKSEPWEKWLAATGALPPDFEKLPSIPFLPDPLKYPNGKDVNPLEWLQRRAELLRMFQHYITGVWPASPGNTRVAEINQRSEAGCTVTEVTLEFGPGFKARLRVEVLIPPGPGPFPVFMTQDTHRRWALIAVSRGYVGCVYAGADSRDDTDAWRAVWPMLDWTRLTRRAWAASRCIDYLQTLPMVNSNQIALTGHSRNGKTSLIGAAFDSRIAAVISSSSGAGGACSYRLFSETQFGEGIENITRAFPDWLHPRLRFFAGHENKLPVDQPELVACIAPRPCLISSALNDNVESIWAVEHTYRSARRVYDLYSKGGELNLRYRAGGHETRAEDIEAYIDWLDSVFGRKEFALPDAILFPTYTDWQQQNSETIDALAMPVGGLGPLMRDPAGEEIKTAESWNKKREVIRREVLWALGDAPPFAESDPGSYGAERPHQAAMLDRAAVPAGLAKQAINFGNYVAGDLYFPTNTDRATQKLPAVIWLHPVSVPTGYVPAYRRGEAPHLALARMGCAVLAFDQLGAGSRLPEIKNFYQRYPQWSILGKHVEDTLAAVEALGKTSFIDPRRIWLLGYATGGMTALHAAALDERVAGVVSVAGFTPYRTDTAGRGTGGIARWTGWMPLIPRLGVFIGHESRVPYDFHELLAMAAPRPALVFAPKVDWQATIDDVRGAVESARLAYELAEAKPAIEFIELDDYNRFSPETQKVVFEKLKQVAGF